MSKYKFYSKSDSTKETLGTIKANTLEEAIDYFSTTKKLPVDTFVNLYQVDKV